MKFREVLHQAISKEKPTITVASEKKPMSYEEHILRLSAKTPIFIQAVKRKAM